MSNQRTEGAKLHFILESVLIFISAVLVCIWAIQHTIALRNLLLSLGSIIGLICGFQFFKSRSGTFSLKNSLPIILLGLVFFWVLVHYQFFSQDPILQYQELTSTWLRCFLAVIVGFSSGLVISKNPNWIRWIFFGLSFSFIVLYAQYLPKVWRSHTIIHIDFVNYIFYGKHNAVLVGTLIIAGLLAALGNLLKIGGALKKSGTILLIILLMFSAVLFAYVYLFDTRNGIGLAVLLLLFSIPFIFIPNFYQNKLSNGKRFGALLIVLVSALTIYFSYRQLLINQGWNNSLEDMQIAVQIDRYPNWQNPGLMGYPKTDSGRQVTVNTYERAAWAVAASRLIYEYPLGNGVLHHSLRRALIKAYPNLSGNQNFSPASHSAWLELGLAFGLPMLALVVGSLLWLLQRFWVLRASPFSTLGRLLCVALLLTYSAAELIGQHGLEMKFYWIALLSGLLWWTDNQQSKQLS